MKFAILSIAFVATVIAAPGFNDGNQGISPNFVVTRDTTFHLLTRENPVTAQVLSAFDMNTVRNSNFRGGRPTRVIIHGFQENLNNDINVLTAAAYLRSYDVNVIMVDWSIGANTLSQITARGHVPAVGAFVADFLDTLVINGILLDLNRVNILGNGLGGHIAGHCGKNSRTGQINTIFGLDPDGRGFSEGDPNGRLYRGDAQYVEIIHGSDELGFPGGDVDFYPNGGASQPGCILSSCSNQRVIHLMIESLNSNALWGRRCTDMSEMRNRACTGHGASLGGEPSNQAANHQGIFFLSTNSNPPFGQGVGSF